MPLVGKEAWVDASRLGKNSFCSMPLLSKEWSLDPLVGKDREGGFKSLLEIQDGQVLTKQRTPICLVLI